MTFQPLSKNNLATLAHACRYNAQGLIPAIAQQYDTKEVLMMAWVNQTALEETLTTGRVCYFSRSRQKLWKKGESSGQIQMLQRAFLDCDGDTILFEVDQKGVACHTGRRSCFYREITPHGLKNISQPLISPHELYR